MMKMFPMTMTKWQQPLKFRSTKFLEKIHFSKIHFVSIATRPHHRYVSKFQMVLKCCSRSFYLLIHLNFNSHTGLFIDWRGNEMRRMQCKLSIGVAIGAACSITACQSRFNGWKTIYLRAMWPVVSISVGLCEASWTKSSCTFASR